MYFQIQLIFETKFYADWCPFSQVLMPRLDLLANMYSSVLFASINCSDTPVNKLHDLQIWGLPTLVFFKNGKFIDTFSGPSTMVLISKKISEICGMSGGYNLNLFTFQKYLWFQRQRWREKKTKLFFLTNMLLISDIIFYFLPYSFHMFGGFTNLKKLFIKKNYIIYS